MNTHFSLYIFDKIWYNFPINFGGISMDEILNNTEDFFDDEFEGITKWDGVAGNTVSQQYGYPKESVDWIKERMIEGWVSRDATNFDWYTDGSRFVIVISK